jgi:NAD(P)H dehydrogenase (quinone)
MSAASVKKRSAAQIAHLRRQRRVHERSRPGDRQSRITILTVLPFSPVVLLLSASPAILAYVRLRSRASERARQWAGMEPMRILYVYCHPLPESFHAAIRKEALAGLEAAGHEVDLLDLYAEKFDPVLSEEARRRYHDVPENRVGLEPYVARLATAETIVLQFPTWCFGMPAMLKGFCDRLLMPGVAFDLSDPARVKPSLLNLRRIVGVVTYGRPWYMAKWMGDPPRKTVTRYLRWFTGGRARAEYHALYHMNVATDAQRKAFIARVGAAMRRI